MKRRSSFLVFLGLLLASPLALANDQHTVSFGYAQTHLSSLKNSDSKDLDLTLYIQTFLLSYDCDNFLRIYSRGERYPSALC
ncbi:hypothetical protein ACNAJP_002992, partial [Salmonella enterica]